VAKLEVFNLGRFVFPRYDPLLVLGLSEVLVRLVSSSRELRMWK